MRFLKKVRRNRLRGGPHSHSQADFRLYGARPERWFSRMNRLAHRMGYPELFPVELLTLARKGWREYDLFHFHDLSGAISPYTLKWLAKRKPVIWTFHDCSPFTAGCLYPMGCERYKTGCGDCPQLHQWPLGCTVDRTRRLAGIKKALHATRRIVTIAPSAWMADLAVGSGMVLDRPRVIPNGVDVKIFRPNENRAEAKTFLGVRRDRPVVLISANLLSDSRKGAVYSFEAVRAIRDLNPFVVIVGKPNPDIADNLQGIDYLCTGFVSDPRLLARWYALADVFVFCSLADNMPLSILETMACGVPIVGFKTGGIPEMVEQAITGFLVEQKDQKSLNEVLRRGVTNGDVGRWGVESRRKVVEEYSMERFISTHKSLYEEVVAQFKEHQLRKA